jgi:SAM-dependent methyltransferase
MGEKEILGHVNAYYTGKITQFGNTPQGVDWNGEESQFLRFEQLSKIIKPGKDKISVLDYGCGTGALYKFLQGKQRPFHYHGFDISEKMIAEAKAQSFENATWSTKLEQGIKFDYVFASGIFNVRLENNDKKWLKYMLGVLDTMNDISIKGFAFNVLTKYSDKPYQKDYLYYADPCEIFDYCKQHYSKYVALLHDYPLYEFSILVRKTD